MDTLWQHLAAYKKSACFFDYQASSSAINNDNPHVGGAKQSNKCKIAYWYQACKNEDASVVLLIHGFPSASWDWHQQWSFLAERYHVLAIDLLGFGISDKPLAHDYTIAEQAEIVNALLTHLDISSLHIIAHDYGVSVAQMLMLLFPSEINSTQVNRRQIASICFLNGGLFAESHRPIFTQKLLKSLVGPLVVKFLTKSSLRKGFIKVFAEHTPPSNEAIDMLWDLLCENNGRLALPRLLRYIDERHIYRDRWVEAMQKASFPIGFINGIHDPVSGEHMLVKFKQLIPNQPSIGIDCGHYPQLEKSALVNTLLLEFLTKGTLGE
jgi:pimeloyl-ACP methyl ester carboxylesterase